MTDASQEVQNPAYRPAAFFFIPCVMKLIANQLIAKSTEKLSSFFRALYDRFWFALRRYLSQGVSDRADALTGSTLLAIIPLLAIIFAIAKGFGMESLIEQQLHKTFYGQEHIVSTLMNFINAYLAHTKSGIFVGVGLLLLIYSVLQLARSMEAIFNDIWMVKKSRSVTRKAADYGAFLLLLPLLMIIMSGLSIFMTQLADMLPDIILLQPVYMSLLTLSPYLIAAIVFTGLYILMPNTPVKLKYAILPGCLSGVLFQLLLNLYLNTQIAVSGYNAIYGSFAAIPIFMIWSNISWNICLFGAEFTFAMQNFTEMDRRQLPEAPSRRYHDFLCALLTGLICKRFDEGMVPYTALRLAVLSELSVFQTQELLNELERTGVIYKYKTDKSVSYIPAMGTSNITVELLSRRLEQQGFERCPELERRYPELWHIYMTDYRDKEKNKTIRLQDKV